MTPRGDEKAEVVSYLTLRRIVGALGVGLPVVLAVWGFALIGWGRFQPSISDYYALRTRDALVGVLFAIGWFLAAYRGYERQDRIAGNLACVFALGVALFPNTSPDWERTVHLCCAGALFLVLAYFSLFLFTRTDGSPTREKHVRNRIYTTCGVGIVTCILLIAAYDLVPGGQAFARLNPVFWLETLALWSFGFSWFVKGDTLFRDAGQSGDAGVPAA